MHPALVSMLVIGATWDAWRWYVSRISAAPEEAAALAMTMALLIGMGIARRSPAAPLPPIPLPVIAGLLALYAVGHWVLPHIIRAAIAITATLFCLHLACFRQRPPIAFWGLVSSALPVLPSLQFTLGYPMRVVSAALAVASLQANGLAVERQGTFLLWRGETIQFDAPCSGVNMLWAGLLLTLMGCVVLRLGARMVAIAVMLSIALALAANVLRASSLFYIEAGMVSAAPRWWHEGIGIAAFMLSAAITLWLLRRLRHREATPCCA
jgi:exosortase/archaeosortase family protein